EAQGKRKVGSACWPGAFANSLRIAHGAGKTGRGTRCPGGPNHRTNACGAWAKQLSEHRGYRRKFKTQRRGLHEPLPEGKAWQAAQHGRLLAPAGVICSTIRGGQIPSKARKLLGISGNASTKVSALAVPVRGSSMSNPRSKM